MNSESETDPASTENPHPSSSPLFLSTSSSSLKPLRERNRTNLKRRTNLSRSQVLSEDFENNDRIPSSSSSTTAAPSLTKTTSTTYPSTTHSSSQPAPSTPPSQKHSDPFAKSASPSTPSPIHTTVTCSQVWERLASNDESQVVSRPKSTSPSTGTNPSASTSRLPTHISFSYESSQDENDETLVAENPKQQDDKNDDDDRHVIEDKGENDEDEEEDDGWLSNAKNGFQYVPLSSQSKLVQFQFLTFARQQSYLLENEDADKTEHNYDHSMNDDDDDDDQDEDDDDDDDGDEGNDGNEHAEGEPGHDEENRPSKKRKRSVSSTDSLDEKSLIHPMNGEDATGSAAATSKPPRTKKPKIKDPNANFQRLNMRKKQFSHAKKHQFGRNKRNAFYRRARNAGGMK